MPFQKGQSGNPGGRRKLPHDVATLAKSKGLDAVKTLIDLLHKSEDSRVRMAAFFILMK